MVNIERLLPGMRVKIVDEWNKECDENPSGEMDKYLGTTMTVRDHLSFNYVIMEEDNGRWYWNGHCIDYIVDDPEIDFEIVSDEDFNNFLFGTN